MPIVKIKIADRNFDLACSDESTDHIKQLAMKLDEEMQIISENNRLASFETLLIMVSLGLLDDKYSNQQNRDIKISQEQKGEDANKEMIAISEIYQDLKNLANKVSEC